jgi:multiple sugar transport system substrate-binding protein
MAQLSRLSRREFLRIVGLSASGSLLAACAARTAPLTSLPAATPGRKTLVLSIQSFAHDAMRPVVDAWSARTGHKVELTSGPSEGQEMLKQYAPAFQARTSPVDLFSLDDSGPVFYQAGWIEPLDDVIPKETWDDFPRLFNPQIELWHSYQGKRYRVPHEFAIGYFWYRKDWFDQKGLKPPGTWDEFVTIGKEYTGAGAWGTLEALLRQGLIYVYLAYFTAQTGGDIFKFDEQTAEAFQFVYDLIYTHRIMPESALSTDYTQQNQAYMQDHVAMMRQWPFFWDVSRGNKQWYAAGKAEIALPPAGPAGAKSWWGGWGFSVPKYAPNKDEALDLIRWITNNEHAPILAKGQSWFIMPRKSILSALGDHGLVPPMKMYIENNVPVARRFHEKVTEAERVVNEVGFLFLTRKISLTEAMKRGVEQIRVLGAST